MRQLVLAIAAVAAAVGVVATPAVSGSTAGKLRLVISEAGHFGANPPAGTFLLSGTVGADSGKTAVTPRVVRSGVRDGQSYKVVAGANTFTGKKGGLVIRFTGVAVDVAEATDVEYGLWTIDAAHGTGAYEGWRGGGRWASTAKGARYTVRWSGLVTR
jgi:hypothetical protein